MDEKSGLPSRFVVTMPGKATLVNSLRIIECPMEPGLWIRYQWCGIQRWFLGHQKTTKDLPNTVESGNTAAHPWYYGQRTTPFGERGDAKCGSCNMRYEPSSSLDTPAECDKSLVLFRCQSCSITGNIITFARSQQCCCPPTSYLLESFTDRSDQRSSIR